MKKTIFTIIASTCLLFNATGSIFAISEDQSISTPEAKIDKKLTQKLDSFFKNRGEDLKTKKLDKFLTKYDEALGLVELMKNVHSQDLINYETEYFIKSAEKNGSSIQITADLYQRFFWAGISSPSEFKDEVKIIVDDSGEVTSAALPQNELDMNQVIDNGNRLKKLRESEEKQSLEKNQINTATAQSYTYSRAGAKTYIDKYWDIYNPTFTEYSNDCTNFASQVINAGGIPMYIQAVGGGATDNNPSWYFNVNSNGLLKSPSWINVDVLFDLMRNYSTIDAVASSFADMQVGDIIQYDKSSNGVGKDHTAVVSLISYSVINGVLTKYVSVSYHTTDRHDIPYDYYATQNNPTSIFYTHINDTQY